MASFFNSIGSGISNTFNSAINGIGSGISWFNNTGVGGFFTNTIHSASNLISGIANIPQELGNLVNGIANNSTLFYPLCNFFHFFCNLCGTIFYL